MTKEEWKVALKEAQDNLNSLVEAARAENNRVNLTVMTKEPMSMISVVSVELVDTSA